MGTIIKSISFQNFYNYYGSYEDNTYTFSEGINIINADNNMGKSKFYNGFLWVLRDEVYDSDEDKQYAVEQQYEKMFSIKARREKGELKMGVRIVFSCEEETFTVEKYVKFREEGPRAVTDIIRSHSNEDLLIMDKEEQQEVIRKLIPADMTKYALLQGESMEQLVDLSSKDGIIRTINALADINNLIKMCELAGKIVKLGKDKCKEEEKRNKAAGEEVTELQHERDNLEKWIKEAKERIKIEQSEMCIAQNEALRYESELFNTKKRIELRADYQEQINELDRLKKQKEQMELSITSRIFDENCPWLLMCLDKEIDQFDSRRTELVRALQTESIIKNPDILLPEGSPDAPSLKRMLEKEICEVCGRPAVKNSEEWLHIRKVLNRPRKPMYSSDSFGQFYGDLLKMTGRYSTSIPMIDADYEAYMNKFFDIEDQIGVQEDVVDQKKEELVLVGTGNTTESNDRSILSAYTQAKKTITDKGEIIQNYNSKIRQWEQKLEKTKKELARKQTSTEVKKAEKNLEVFEAVEALFNSTKERIFNEIVENLQQTANKMYTGLTAGNQTTGGELKFERQGEDVIKVSVLNNEGEELYGNGKGFKRMKQLAIVMSIISSKVGNKQFDYPFISDAPFSEFGPNFINNFLNIAPNVFRQSIIMIKDLSDSTAKEHDFLTPAGLKIAKRMRDGEIKGTFYVNYTEERTDNSNMVTLKKCLSN